MSAEMCEFMPCGVHCSNEGAYTLLTHCECGRDHEGPVCGTCAVAMRRDGAICKACREPVALVSICTLVSA